MTFDIFLVIDFYVLGKIETASKKTKNIQNAV